MAQITKVLNKVDRIRYNQLSIYENVDLELFFSKRELEFILTRNLVGVSLYGLPIRTRSRVVKEYICDSLGYIIPKSFKKTQPRFLGQNFDIYVQKSNNLQIWNEEIDIQRRYILIKVNEEDVIIKIKVISGYDLSLLDTTGTLTKKYQARLPNNSIKTSELIAGDTKNVSSLLSRDEFDLSNKDPLSMPKHGELLPIQECFSRLRRVIGASFPDLGATQERNRGRVIHEYACKALGYSRYSDDGQFPDIKHQLIEVKLQTSPTIDLGVVCPDSDSMLDLEKFGNLKLNHSDVRYAVFYGDIINGFVYVRALYLTSGKYFFDKFEKFGGNVINSKIQIPLPPNFF